MYKYPSNASFLSDDVRKWSFRIPAMIPFVCLAGFGIPDIAQNSACEIVSIGRYIPAGFLMRG